MKATDAAARYLQMLTAAVRRIALPGGRRLQCGSGPRLARALAHGPGGGGEETGGQRRPEGEDEDVWSDEHFFSLADTRYIRKETKDYVPKLIAAALIAKTPEVYGFSPVPRRPIRSRSIRSWCPT